MSGSFPKGAIVLATALAFAGSACEKIVIDNSAPRLTWFHAAPARAMTLDEAPDRLVVDLTIWISDLDGDPVDLAVSWLGPGESTPESEKPVVISSTYGHGTEGLTTHEAVFEEDGAPHLLAWDVTGLPSGQVKLRFVPRDLPGDQGKPGESPAFDPASGLGAPAAFVAP